MCTNDLGLLQSFIDIRIWNISVVMRHLRFSLGLRCRQIHTIPIDSW